MSAIKIIAMLGSDPGLKPYEGFIFSSYLHSLREGNDWFHDIDKDKYYEVYHLVLERILVRNDTVVRLAVLSDDLDVALGWSAIEGSTLHYVYVKDDKDIQCRRQHIAKDLVPGNISVITHLTRIGRLIWKRKLPKAVFDPFR